MIAVHDPEVAERLRRLRAHAMDTSDLARHTARDVTFEAYPERGFNAADDRHAGRTWPVPAGSAR